jgi:hypothetical protein
VDVPLPREKVSMILNCLVEGNSVHGTARLCDVEKRTVLSILTLAGDACGRLLSSGSATCASGISNLMTSGHSPAANRSG